MQALQLHLQVPLHTAPAVPCRSGPTISWLPTPSRRPRGSTVMTSQRVRAYGHFLSRRVCIPLWHSHHVCLIFAVPFNPAPTGMAKHEHTLQGGVNGGWFVEISDQWPGQAMAIKLKETLFEGKSAYQDVKVFETENYGKMMTLDGVIQSTERDEFAYHEMIAHLPLFSHPNPEHVCVIGGGDGGVLREVVKHPSVKHAVLCDIDDVVIAQSRVHLKHLSVGFDHPKCEVLCGDGLAFLRDKENAYDVIIIDSSDPDGPASGLFGADFYKLVHKALKPGGVTCSQGECVWLHLPLIKSMADMCRDIYANVQYAYCTIPTYPSGQIGFLLCAKGEGTKFHEPLRAPVKDQQDTFQYYSPSMHRAAFVLPEFARKKLGLSVPELAFQ